MSISIRSSVPKNIVVMQYDNNIPTDYTKENSLYDKFIRCVPSAATEPGSTDGSATHLHSSDGSHSHGASGSTAQTYITYLVLMQQWYLLAHQHR